MLAGMAPLSPSQRHAIAAAAEVDPRSVRRVERGEPIRESTAVRIVRAAKKLGLRLPKPVVAVPEVRR